MIPKKAPKFFVILDYFELKSIVKAKFYATSMILKISCLAFCPGKIMENVDFFFGGTDFFSSDIPRYTHEVL